ncbi:MAG: succinylglutamate desuccinylase/aspartoacylase family protein [Polyangiales bacterium]
MQKQERRKTGLKASPRAPFEINGVMVPAGKLTQVELRLARLPTGMWISLPVGVLHGRHEGPVIWVSAAIHGDELNGVPIIRHLLDAVDPRRLSGTVLAVPVVNVQGLIQESRYLPDRRDLNRCFPGSKRGSSAAQLAHLFMTEIVARCELGLDLHTGSGGRTNLPQLRRDLDEPGTLRLVHEFGAPVLLHSRLRDGSLRAAARDLDKVVLVYEAGEASRFNNESIEMGVEGILRVMTSLGMIHDMVGPPKLAPRISRASSWLRARRRRDRSPVKAKSRGIVIGHVTSPIVHRGDAIAHIAEMPETVGSEGQ